MFVYILYSEKRSRYYVGQTADIRKRLIRHNLGVVPSTKGGAPWVLVLQIEVLSRSEAIVLEHRIKKRRAKRYIDDHFGDNTPKASEVSPGH
ncbi:excinuclease ABC subunit C [Arenibacter sp. TNZ]|uniref:GIY-YIG nuclease family protein n=1 Tax=Arenibacter TaxID=178469 RepID=UPI000CD41921|nr:MULTISPECIES: GIY-YIG nuclease family protein [Arenibacter]MCM4169857.1 excinuclease ABC subunit C [Arenibacter sp. TNZ]